MEKENNSQEKTFFCAGVVGEGWRGAIEERFETLIASKCERPFDWYKELGLDKADASRIRRGLVIPPKWLKIKIAQYFEVDSITIWESEK